jgi:OOP family OmpA-OmpF porin
MLAETGRVDVYDIYFDFNSERIREESRPTLDEIAEALGRHPDWRLTIEGHTDDIGSDVANCGLAKRRAASVEHALVAVCGIADTRLTTTGHGEARAPGTGTTRPRGARATGGSTWYGIGNVTESL